MIKTAINRRLFLNGLLLVVVVSLIGVVVQQANKTVVVDSLYDKSMGNEIDSIVIHYQKSKTDSAVTSVIELQKVADQWVMIEPIKTAIDERKIKHLTTLLSDAIDASYSVANKDLSIFGLNDKEVSITFNGVKIQFGSLNPISHKRYIRKGDRIYLVSETVYGLLIGGVSSFMRTNIN